MNINLFSLVKGDGTSFAPYKKLISDCANVFTPTPAKFTNFASPKRMFLAVSQALRSADCVIIAVQSQSYNSIKKLLCSALELETRQNEEIYVNLLSLHENGKISNSSLVNNSLFPVGADIFATDDMLCCGYALTSGGQSIVVVPLDSIKTSEVVFGSLYEFLAEKTGVEVTKGDFDKLKCLRLTERLFTSLSKTKSTLSLACVNGSDIFEECAKAIDKNGVVFRFKNNIEPRIGSQAVKEYLASCAQKMRIETKTDYAVVLSSAFSSNEGDVFIYCATADNRETNITKVFAQNDEDAADLIPVGAQFALKNAGNCIISKQDRLNSKAAKASNRLRQNIITAVAFAIGGSATICALLALLMG